MKITKFIIVSATAGMLIMYSCNKKLELAPGNSLPTSTALGSVKGVNAAMVGMYAQLRNVNYYGRGLFIYGDLSSDDVYLSKTNSNRFLSTFQRNYAANDADMLGLWTAMYAAIAQANNIIQAVDKLTATDAEKAAIKGQALFVRALGYFDLVRVFAKPYNQGGGAQAGVPLVLVSDVAATPGRNTVADVYTQVIKDLTDAKALLSATDKAVKLTASKYAAAALLSRVYLYKEDYANVIVQANEVTAAGYALTAPAALPGFYATPANEEEIFTVKVNAVESLGSNNLGNMYLKAGYGDIRVSPDLVNVFDKTNDLRYNAFIGAFPGSPAEFQNNKYTGQDNTLGLYSAKVLRLAEVLLNRAEAYAKTAKPTEALADLNAVKQKRGLTAVNGLTGDALVNEVLTEKRREFMFEGSRFFDLLRTGKGVARNYCNQVTQVTVTRCALPANDAKAIAPIPQAEIDANPGLKGQQNQDY
jgi:hypothetical protein